MGKLFYTIGFDLKKRNNDDHSYSTTSQFNKAMKHYEQCNTLSQKIEDSVGLIEAPKGIGNCYRELGKFDEAIKNYEKCAQRATEYFEINHKVEAYCQIVKTHILKGDGNDEYKTYFDEVLRICKDPKSDLIQKKNKNPNIFKKVIKKKVNSNHIKDLMQFIEEQKDKNKRKEENKFRKMD